MESWECCRRVGRGGVGRGVSGGETMEAEGGSRGSENCWADGLSDCRALLNRKGRNGVVRDPVG